ncbi:nucleotidase [Sulfolobales archaeon HS-7]|nr:nucleotidase [Sulfolobales archaeon HS-7]
MSGSIDDYPVSRSGDDSIIKILEEKVKSMQVEIESLRKELIYYKSEFEKLMSPPLIEATVLDVLEDGRVVVRSSSGPNLIVNVSHNIDYGLIKPGSVVALSQRGSTVVEVLPDRDDLLVKSLEVIDRPNVTFTDIGGLDEQIREIKEVVQLPLTNPSIFKEIGIEPPKGILLYGPPGTGKTMLAKAVARESNATFLHVVASEFAQKFVGEGAKLVKELFELARKKKPSIVFIDEIDAIAAKRIEVGTSGEREIQRTLMQLLSEIDGFNNLEAVKVIAATNRIDILDPAILRPGRFDRLIYVPLPNEKGREEIFKIYLKRMKISEKIDVKTLALMTNEFSGADIKNVCIEAAYQAIREGRTSVSGTDFIAAVNYIKSKKNNLTKNVERSEKFI